MKNPELLELYILIGTEKNTIKREVVNVQRFLSLAEKAKHPTRHLENAEIAAGYVRKAAGRLESLVLDLQQKVNQR